MADLPGIMGAGEEDSRDLLFPYLKIVDITFSLITYDGRWYYTGNPNKVKSVADLNPGEEYGPDLDSDSDLNSNSSFDSESWGRDNIDQYREAVLNGDEPQHLWRQKPDPDTFYPLVRAMVAAAMRMPKLEHLRMGPGDVHGYEIDFEYIRPKLKANIIPSRKQTEEQLRKWRWIVSPGLETSWEVPDDIRQLMEQHVGEDGEVIVLEMSSLKSGVC